MDSRTPWVAALAMMLSAGCPALAGGFIASDRSFFDRIPHTLLDFETRGNGTPVDLGFLEFEFFGEDEYLSKGIRFASGQYAWDTVPPPSIGGPLDPEGLGGLGDAVAAVGSVPTVLATSEGSEIHFLGEVRAFGIGVVQNGFPWPYEPSETGSTMISVFDASGDLIDSVRLWGDLIDVQFGSLWAGGIFGDDFRQYQVGFIGLASETPIAFIRFSHPGGALYDHLYFSAVPAPSAGMVMGLGALGMAMRRRR